VQQARVVVASGLFLLEFGAQRLSYGVQAAMVTALALVIDVITLREPVAAITIQKLFQ